MVVKLRKFKSYEEPLFESSVILYGSQAMADMSLYVKLFESSVILYGSQAWWCHIQWIWLFESSVILYGSQAPPFNQCC